MAASPQGVSGVGVELIVAVGVVVGMGVFVGVIVFVTVGVVVTVGCDVYVCVGTCVCPLVSEVLFEPSSITPEPLSVAQLVRSAIKTTTSIAMASLNKGSPKILWSLELKV